MGVVKLPPYFLFTMAKKKAGARERANKFIDMIGTAGGPVGSPSLVMFGAGDTALQVQSGNVDQYAPIRAADMAPGVGTPENPLPPMPRDLDNAYMKLNLPGSPLPANGLLAPSLIQRAEALQKQINIQAQYAIMPLMPLTGQLPMGMLPPQPKKGSK
jgi:hypothetical protein|tara:strand:+ start:369 stop:842 length:474 start_codon:yes stop_codon:yes gene_type:complete